MDHLLAADSARQMATQGRLYNTEHSLQAAGSEVLLTVRHCGQEGTAGFLNNCLL